VIGVCVRVCVCVCVCVDSFNQMPQVPLKKYFCCYIFIILFKKKSEMSFPSVVCVCEL